MIDSWPAPIRGGSFSEALTAAGDEIVEPPPSMEPITVTVNGIDYNYQEAAALTVLLNDPIPVVVTAGALSNL